ncbi:MAG: polyphenol oxidase family protein [Chthoniobacter sp.]|nr:polyphenol oxidase family protein [Chthoniobacter sp.]
MNAPPLETFSALAALPGVAHGFTGRFAGIDVQADREVALRRLDGGHAQARAALGAGKKRFVIGEQVHGREVAVVDENSASPVPGVDGLITASPEVCLGVCVADCCAVYLADPVRRVIALLHSGRKGSELGITAVAIERMRADFGSAPEDLVVQLSPCIRPPLYEVNFAALILAQCCAAGVRQVHDCGTCTGTQVARYYSYRVERGKTGRMLALLALTATS